MRLLIVVCIIIFHTCFLLANEKSRKPASQDIHDKIYNRPKCIKMLKKREKLIEEIRVKNDCKVDSECIRRNFLIDSTSTPIIYAVSAEYLRKEWDLVINKIENAGCDSGGVNLVYISRGIPGCANNKCGSIASLSSKQIGRAHV